MAISTNLPTIDLEETVEYFNNYFQEDISVTQNVVDALFAFFEPMADNKEATNALVHAIIITAFDNKINPISVLDEFKNLDALKVDAYLAMFLNLSRKNTSLIGVSNVPAISSHIARTLLP